METSQCEARLTSRQKLLLGASAAGIAGGYFAYRIYRSDSLAALLELRARLRESMSGCSRSLLLASECTSLVVRDLRDFLHSDADEVPQSLRQLAKLANTQEASLATSLLTAAAVRGAVTGAKSEATTGSSPETALGSSDFSEKLLEGLTSKRILQWISSDFVRTDEVQTCLSPAVASRGMDLVALAVKVACQTTVTSLCEAEPTDKGCPSWWQQIVELGSTPKGEVLYTACIGSFVREGMKVYMGAMAGVNPWEDFLTSLSKTEHQSVVGRLMRTFVSELVTSCFKKARYGHRSEGRLNRAGAAKQALLSPYPHTASSHALPTAEPDTSGGESVRPQLCDEPAFGSLLATASTSGLDYLAVAQQFMQPEVRGLLTLVVGTAAFEGVRSCLLATREMLTGVPGVAPALVQPPVGGQQLQQLSSRALGALLLFVFMPVIIFLAGRRAALS